MERRDIFTLSRDERVRNLARLFIATTNITSLDTRFNTPGVHPGLGRENIECGLCGRVISLSDHNHDTLFGIATLLLDPKRYLLEGETVVCRCTKDRGEWDSYYTFAPLDIRITSDQPRFSHQRPIYPQHLSIYNRDHNYYMHIGKWRYSPSDFELRASNFTKYDPYRVKYITLFDTLFDALFDMLWGDTFGYA